MVRGIIFVGLILACETTFGQTGLRFDPQRGVVGSAKQKRAWLEQALEKALPDEAQRQDAQRRLDRMNRREISALANHLFARRLRQAAGHGAWGGRFPGAVGFVPVITWLPEGTNLGVGAVVSQDRRFVRITASPFFSSIPSVDTFNFVTGRTTRQYAPYRPPGWNHMPPPPPSPYVQTWHDGLRTRNGPRPPRR